MTPEQPVRRRSAEAVFLVADASGFSRMCADILAQDNRGADVIATIVNAHIRRLTRAVAAHGGVVLTFSGDSIWACWPADGTVLPKSLPKSVSESPPERLRARLAAATAAAQTIAGNAGTGSASGGDAGTPAMAMHFGCMIDHGPCELWSLPVGGHEKNLLAGETPERLVRAANGMRGGDVQLSEASARVLGPETCVTETTEPGAWVRTMPAVQAAPALTLATAADAPEVSPEAPRLPETGVWDDEICRATILFMRFPDLPTDHPEAFALLGAMIHDAVALVDQAHGRVVQAQVDDKGLVFVAAWGLSRNRAEDDAARASQTAGALLGAARARQLAAAIGVGTGRVFAGTVGDAHFRTYTVLGAAANRAAWLMQRARDGVLVDAATADAAARHMRFSRVAELVFKGETTPEPVFAPDTEHRTAPRFSDRLIGRLIGRDAETQAFRAAIDAGRHPAIWVSGEAGIGKSHFLQSAMEELRAQGVQVLTGGGESMTRNQPFAAWRPILSQLTGRLRPEARHAAEALIRRVGSVADRMALARLMGLDLPDETDAGGSGEPSPQVLPQAPETVLDAALAFLTRQLAETEVALVFEDAHWIDTASWTLIAAAQARMKRARFVLSARPLDPWTLPLEARPLHGSDQVCHIALRPLPPEAARDLIGAVLGARVVPEALVTRIHARTEGHPYYTKELTAALKRRQAVKVRDGHCYIANGAETVQDSAFPEDIEAAISSRFSELPGDAQLTLKVASVIGRSFASEDLLPVHPLGPDPAEVARHLREARRLDLLEEARDGAGLRFHHALTRDAIYGLMTEAQRRQLHAEAARSLEARGARDDPAKLSMLGHHWATAGERERAIGFLTAAAEHAGRSQSYYEQIQLLRQAMQLDAGRPKPAARQVRGLWETQIARAFFQLGDVPSSVRHGERAVHALVSRMPSPLTLGPRLVAEIARIKLRRPGPAATDEAERQVLLSAAQTCIEMAFHSYEIGRLPFSMFTTFLAVNLARRAGGPSVPLAIGNANLAIASLSLPFLFDGRALQQEAIAIAEALDDRLGKYWIGVSGSTHAFATGRLDEAVALADMAVRMARAHLAPRDHEAALSHKANFLRARGQYAEALALDRQALTSGRDRGSIQGRIWGLNGCCRSLLALGRTAELRAHVDELGALLSDSGNTANLSINNHFVLSVSRAQLALIDGDGDGARPVLRHVAGALVRILGPQYYLEELPGALGDALLRSWQLSRGRDVVPLARLVLKGARLIARTYPVARYRPHLAKGDLALFRGRPAQAREHWLAARDIARAQGLGMAQAQAEMRLGLDGTAPAVETEAARDRLRQGLAAIGVPVPAHWEAVLDHPG